MAKKLGDFRKGQGMHWKDGLWILQEKDHVKPGKGPAYLQCQLRNVETGTIVTNRFSPDDTLEPVHFDRRDMEYLYTDANSHVLMDTETYDQLELPKAVLGDNAVYLTENLPIAVCFVEGRIISAELPNTVELVVEDVPPNVKGATATNQLKDALCEGGARVRVPPFVENGTRIKVDTRTGEYLGRV